MIWWSPHAYVWHCHMEQYMSERQVICVLDIQLSVHAQSVQGRLQVPW